MTACVMRLTSLAVADAMPEEPADELADDLAARTHVEAEAHEWDGSARPFACAHYWNAGVSRRSR